ncbi:O-antigen ligase family protein [Vibrio sp. S9_S30]|uniref:O-antigen ligase family protein n=1 Tax=Vibrio sp. S9_S30 TaxID=2720226 RepID=UPI0016817C1E|nr:O-antigen ligase [Vibrio sp. S9_S30]MBD1558491.1 O-antigen ligase family protein [Vibrio sp. S9_S30]
MQTTKCDEKQVLLSSILVFLYPITLLIQPYSYSWLPILIALVSLAFYAKTRKRVSINESQKLTHWLILSYFISIVASYLIFDGPPKQLDIPNRILLIFPIVTFLMAYRPSTTWVILGIGIGGVIAGIIAVYMHFVLNVRALGALGYMSIQASGMAMTLGILSLVGMFHFIEKRKTAFAFLTAIGSCGGIGASLLSGGRGAWLISPFIIAFLLWHYRKWISPRLAVIALLLFSAVLSITYPVIEKRITAINYDLQIGGQSSSAVRIELWKAAIYIGKEFPIFGTGYHNLIPEKQKLVDIGIVEKSAVLFSNAHNQYLDALQERGIIGLMAIFAMCIAPIWYFKKQYQRHKNTDKAYFAVMGICHITLLMGYFLTQTYLNHHSGILLYITFTAIFMAMCTESDENGRVET